MINNSLSKKHCLFRQSNSKISFLIATFNLNYAVLNKKIFTRPKIREDVKFNNKYPVLIYEFTSNNYQRLGYLQIFLNSLNLLMIYKFSTNYLLYSSYFCFFGCSMIFLLAKFSIILGLNLKRIITKLTLTENGLDCEIVTLYRRRPLLVKKSLMRNLTIDEFNRLNKIGEKFLEKFYPIVIKEKVFFLAIQNEFLDLNLLSKLLENKYNHFK